MRVIVLDCFTRMGASVINSVDRSYELIGGSAGQRSRALRDAQRFLRSPRLSSVFDHPHPNVDPSGFRAAILDACDVYRADAVFPASTASAHGLAQLRRDAECDIPATFVIDDHARLVRFSDKWQLFELCRQLEIPAPPTALAEQDLDVAGVLGLPVVVKPRLGEGARGLRIVSNADELEAMRRSLRHVGAQPEHGPSYIVQQFVSGSIHNVGACTLRGRAVSMMTQQRIFTRYEFGGSGFVHRTTYEPLLMEYAERLLDEVSWSGPVLLEFLRDEEGQFHLIDGNPRVWASTELTVAAGMNVCQQAVDIFVLGREPEPVTDYRVGLTLRWISAGSVAACLRSPRTPGRVWSRLRTLLAPRRPAATFTNLRLGSFRHLAGLTLHHVLGRRGKHTGA